MKNPGCRVLLPSEVSRNLPIVLSPISGCGWCRCFRATTSPHVLSAEKLFGLGVTRQFGLAFFLFYPVDGVHAVTVDGHVETFLFQQGKSGGQWRGTADIVGSIHRSEVKDFPTVWRRIPRYPWHRDFRCRPPIRQAVFPRRREGSVGAGTVLAGRGATV